LEFKTLNDRQRGCFAEIMLKKSNKGDLKKWVDGKKKIEEIRGDSTGVDYATQKCLAG
jgi:hypothetical protein